MSLALSVAPATTHERGAVLADNLDPAAFAVFYETVAPRLWRYLFFAVRDRALADDLAQDAFARVLASRLVPENEEHLRRYLFRTASNLVADRRRRAPPPHESVEDLDLEARVRPEGLRLDLLRALRQLKPRDRQVLYLAHVEEMDHRAIGEAMEISAISVRVLLFRARRRLAVVLEREDAVIERTSP